MADERLTGDQVAALGLDDWRPVRGALRTRFATGSFVTGLLFVTRISDAAEEANHHPDVDLRYPHVDIALSSHDVGGMTQRDVDLAHRISQIASDLGVAADPSAPTAVEIGLDTADEDQIRPFWEALLGDPAGAVPPIWFQDTEPHETPRQRFHLDVWVPVDQAGPRIEAALAAGGTLVSDEEAPSFVVLTDAQGNQACICTTASRAG